MRKHFLLLVLLTALICGVYATPIDPTRAISVAEQFMPSQPTLKKSVVGGTSAQQTSEIVYTHYMPKSGKPAIYIVNINGGFALVSADDVAHPVLGYNYGKPWPMNIDSIAPSVKGFLDDLAAQMEAASEHPQDAETAAEWQQPRRTPNRALRRTSNDNIPDSVGPLLTTTWDQGQYYNAMCPADGQSQYDGHVPTGCVATAMAQIIKYWGDKQEIKTRGIHSYDSNYGNLRVNYDSTSYDFAHMPNQLTDQSTQHEINAVAKLMYECGVAVNMGYGSTESGAYNEDIRGALVNNFTFDPSIQFAEKNYMRNAEWESLITHEIAAERPVMYGGVSLLGGHEFICDGYKQDGYFHFNFGWSGQGDGWFLLSAITPNDLVDYSSYQSAFLNIIPNTTGATTYYTQRALGQYDYFTISETIDLYSMMANNEQPFSTVTYGSYEKHTLTFYPSDSTKQLELYILDVLVEDFWIYDGDVVDSSALLLSGIAHNFPIEIERTPILSSKHALTIQTISSPSTSLHFRLREGEGCFMVTEITARQETDWASLRWSDNYPLDSQLGFEIEYGPHGFTHGTGTTLTTDEKYIKLEDLQAQVVYDAYIRVRCDSNHYSAWSEPTILTLRRPYWSEVVTEQPEGFMLDDEGNITISTPEGLVWLQKLNDNCAGRTINLVNDIDMSAYIWDGTMSFSGTFDGNNHVISGLDAQRWGSGVFQTLTNGCIKNLGVKDCSFLDHTSLVYFAKNSVIYNCFYIGEIKGEKYSEAAGLVSSAEHTTIINCYTIGNIYGYNSAAGICNTIKNGKILNCYTFTNIKSEIAHLNGAILASQPYSVVENCYAGSINGTVDLVPRFVRFTEQGETKELCYFTEENQDWRLSDTLQFESGSTTNLIEALNKGIEKFNMPGLQYWIPDTAGINQGLPIFSNIEYIPQCENVKDVTCRSISKNSQLGLEIAISPSENANTYVVKYGVLKDRTYMSVDTVLYDTLYSSLDTIWGLQEGSTYLLKVMPYCDSTHHGAWSDLVSIVHDIPYWHEIVTEKPEGYIEDEHGNVFISSAEGLAWLNCVVNGENGQLGSSLSGKIVSLTSDIQLGGYKWKPLKQCQFILNGNHHIIDGLYVNEGKDSVGLFASLRKNLIMNIRFTNARIYGNQYVGTVCGEAWGTYMFNVFAETEVKGNATIGGLASRTQILNLDYCGVEGTVEAEFEGAGGLVMSASYGDYIRNCYVRADVRAYRSAGVFMSSANFITAENSYANGDITSSMWSGGLLASSCSATVRNGYSTWIDKEDLGYLVDYQEPLGTTIGYLHSLQIENVYYPQGAAIPVVGTIDIQDGQPLECVDTASYNSASDNQQLTHPITVGQNSCSTLLEALNAWVDANDTIGQYAHWMADTANVNRGFPMFAGKPNNHVVAYQNYDGTLLQVDLIPNGTKHEYTGSKPNRSTDNTSSYTFIGWDSIITPVTNDIIYTAIYSSAPRTYTIKFVQQIIQYNKIKNQTLQTLHLYPGDMPEYTGPEPFKEPEDGVEYQFAGWNPEIVPVTENATYTAVFTTISETGIIDLIDPESLDLPQKIFRNGQIFILKGDKVYTLQGQEVK